ncbi:hypothetical protein KKB43_05235 [Patescibacteria group bacterium]|nr:hypothetical protein [Patescibacteria group bacterium]MBU4580389.1 hypothetical protein [Patescibacteria group bacterium]
MAEITEIIVSAIILFFVLFGIYHRFLRKLVLPVSAKTVLEGLKGKIGDKIKRPSLGKIITIVIPIAIAIIIGAYFYLGNTPGAIYTFNSTNNWTSSWNVVSGTWQAQNGCLVGSGEIRLKNEAMTKGWSKVEVVPPTFGDPCGSQGLNGLIIQIGDIIYPYKIGPAPEKRVQQGKYHVGGMFYQAVVEDDKHIFGARSSKLIDKGKEGPYPIGIDRRKWFEVLQPKLEMYICYTDEPLCPRVLAYSNSKTGVNEEGTFSIKSGGMIKIKEVKIFY